MNLAVIYLEYVKVGKIYTTHGLNGELKVKSNFDYKNNIYKNGFIFYFGKDKELFKLKNYRTQNQYDLLTFEALDDIDKVIKYRGVDLYINREDIKVPGYLNTDLIGLDVFYKGKSIGKVTGIFDAGHGNFILDIDGTFIPKNDNFIDKVDLKNKKMIVKNMEGLL